MDYQILKNSIEEHLLKFETITDEDWNLKISPEKWSKKEILGHLCDSAFTNIRRFIVTQYKENENIIYDQDFWVKAQNYQQIPAREIIALWKSLNYQIIHIVENIPDDVLKNVCDTTKNSQKIQVHTLEFLVKDYIEHMNHHLKFI